MFTLTQKKSCVRLFTLAAVLTVSVLSAGCIEEKQASGINFLGSKAAPGTFSGINSLGEQKFHSAKDFEALNISVGNNTIAEQAPNAMPDKSDLASAVDGVVSDGLPLAGALVTITDKNGKEYKTKANYQGYYMAVKRYQDALGQSQDNFVAPFLVRASLGKKTYFSLYENPESPGELPANRYVTVNVTPLTDKIVSDLAVLQGGNGSASMTPKMLTTMAKADYPGVLASDKILYNSSVINSLRLALGTASDSSLSNTSCINYSKSSPDAGAEPADDRSKYLFNPIDQLFGTFDTARYNYVDGGLLRTGSHAHDYCLGNLGLLQKTLVYKSALGATLVTANGFSGAAITTTYGLGAFISEFNAQLGTQARRQGAAFQNLIDSSFMHGTVDKTGYLAQMRADPNTYSLTDVKFKNCSASSGICFFDAQMVSTFAGVSPVLVNNQAVRKNTSGIWLLYGDQIGAVASGGSTGTTTTTTGGTTTGGTTTGGTSTTPTALSVTSAVLSVGPIPAARTLTITFDRSIDTTVRVFAVSNPQLSYFGSSNYVKGSGTAAAPSKFVMYFNAFPTGATLVILTSTGFRGADGSSLASDFSFVFP